MKSIVFGEIIMKKIKQKMKKKSNGGSTKSLSKSLVNSIIFGKEIIMKKIKMKKRFGLNRQKSRAIVENVLSGTKAGFKAILNFEHPNGESRMFSKKSSSTFSAILPALILGLIVLWTGPAAAQKYVTDPSTGMVVTAPEYGGTLTFVRKEEPAGPDTVVSGGWADAYAAGVSEKLVMADWATPRDKFDFQYLNPPTNTKGALAESWSQPDPLTYIVKVRQDAHWHKKAPMNGRALTAQDIVINFHRILGIGSGFTEPSEFANQFKNAQMESITATDESTVVFKLKELNLGALNAILNGNIAWIYPPEVLQEHGDVTDWKNLVGTGPMMLTDWTKGSSITWKKNPEYWGYDEKYPQNRLPYIDQLRALIMPETATQLAAIRSGKADYIGPIGQTQMRTLDQVESLQRTNPELVIYPFFNRSDNGIGMNVQIKPFDDIRVRKAMQMALNLEEINNAYYKGFADMTPQGQLNRSFTEVVTQFEDWPEEVKKVFDYDPEGAKKLLAEAGYPNGFKSVLMHIERYDLNYVQLLASYWKKIGVDVEIEVQPVAAFVAKRSARDFEMVNAEAAGRGSPLGWQSRYTPSAPWNSSNVDDPAYTAKFEAGGAATTIEEQNRIAGELNQYGIEKFWTIWGPMAPQYLAIQPWIIGFNAELNLGQGQNNTVFTRLWIDQELKDRTR